MKIRTRVARGFAACFFILLLLISACATSPTGRRQLMLVSDAQMNAMGAQAFEQLKEKTPVVKDPALTGYVKCVAGAIAQVAKAQTGVDQWDIQVFKDNSANAFALPGGKIGVHTGILPVAQNDGQLAAVLGHEVGHVIAHHGAERVSEAIAAQGGLALIDAFILGKSMSDEKRQLLMGALGVGAQLGVILPHSRTQESEADVIGLKLMAQAGFDPRQSVALWRNMIQASPGGAPPEFLSTHPASENRIANLEAHIPEVMKDYQRALASGHRPVCSRP
jgi:predicted Zn-dependent protease